MCDFIGAICLVGCGTSLLTMGIIGLNRYFNVCNNKYYKKVFTLKNTYIVCLLCWIGGLLLDFPNLFGWGNHIYDLKTASCVWNRLARFSHTIFFSSMAVYIPCSLILICYIKIFHYIYKKRVNSMINNTNTTIDHTIDKKSLRIAISLFIPFIILTICW